MRKAQQSSELRACYFGGLLRIVLCSESVMCRLMRGRPPEQQQQQQQQRDMQVSRRTTPPPAVSLHSVQSFTAATLLSEMHGLFAAPGTTGIHYSINSQGVSPPQRQEATFSQVAPTFPSPPLPSTSSFPSSAPLLLRLFPFSPVPPIPFCTPYTPFLPFHRTAYFELSCR